VIILAFVVIILPLLVHMAAKLCKNVVSSGVITIQVFLVYYLKVKTYAIH
jgi:hypothetical protein